MKALEGPRYKDYIRGDAAAIKNGPVTIEAEYVVPIEVHNPMELQPSLLFGTDDDKVTVMIKRKA